MKSEYKFDENKYQHAFKCNGAGCGRRNSCKWFFIKKYEAYEFIKAPLICNKYKQK